MTTLGILYSIGKLATNFRLSSLNPVCKGNKVEKFDQHSAYILTSASLLSITAPFSIRLQTMFAVHLVTLYSPCAEQRDHAQGLFHEYEQNLIMKPNT